MFSKEASEGARLDEKTRRERTKRKEEKGREKRGEGQSSKKGRDEAARPINTNYKHPLQRHYDKYNIYIL